MKISLKAARVNAGYTQKSAGETLGVSRDTIRSWEIGRSFPDALQIRKIETAFGVTFDDIEFLPRQKQDTA